MKKRLSAWELIFSIALCIVTACIVVTNVHYFCYKMNADIAAESILAKVVWDSGEWIPKSWYPSTEMRILATPNLAAFFYGMTKSLTLCMGLACICMTVVILICVALLGKRLEWTNVSILVFMLLFLILPNHFVVLELFYLFASYYGSHIILFLLSLVTYLMYIDMSKTKTIGNSKKNIILVSFITLVTAWGSFVMGMQGVRGLLITALPLFATECVRIFFVIVHNHKVPKLYPIVYASVLVVLGALGTRMPYSVGQGVSKNLRNGPVKFFQVIILDAIRSIGFFDTNLFGKILLCVAVVITLRQIILAIYRLFVKTQEIHNKTTWILCFFVISSLASMAAGAFTTMESSERYYFMWIFLIAYGVVLTLNEVRKKEWIYTLYAGVIVLGIMNLYAVYEPIFSSDPNNYGGEYKEIGDYLIENDYKMGYATFESAGIITIFTDGEVWVSPVADISKMNICKWLSSTEWYVPNVSADMKTAYIIPKEEIEKFEQFEEKLSHEVSLEKEIGKYYIFSSPINDSNLNE